MKLDSSIQYVKGVGPKRAAMFARLKIYTIEDACLFLPRSYEDRGNVATISQIKAGENYTIIGEIMQTGMLTTPRQRRRIFEAVIGDDSGIMSAKWFQFNANYFKSIFKKGVRIMLSGTVEHSRFAFGGKQIIHPTYEILNSGDKDLTHIGRIIPIYPATEGFNQKAIRSVMKVIIDLHSHLMCEVLPLHIRQKYNLIPIDKAVRQVHFPDKGVDIQQLNKGISAGHRRLVFEEFFLLELGLAGRRQKLSEIKSGIAFKPKGALSQSLAKRLPFTLTTAQIRVLDEIKEDMSKPQPMHRLLQGDVGSGKTIVAVLSLLWAVEAGYQAAIMAPTEILAKQHYFNIHKFLDELSIECVLLKADLKTKEKQNVYEAISSGQAQVIIGTHAIIQKKVNFHKLGFIIIDEQHRFGVMQRANLMRKGVYPDVLVMTATPIPRSLALTVYGDLSLSVIDQMPPGRIPVDTKLYYERDRSRLYKFINQQVSAGGQIYIVYPLIEESEKMNLKAATDMSNHLAGDIFPHLKIGLLHGRLSGAEKEAIMRDFKAHKLNILVSTTVIEVGIDIPNASVMVIEHAERFGLAQLHQLRGRVGRGDKKSYCCLMAAYPITEEAKQRLGAMLSTRDGFMIAEEDLKIRGPGEFLGTRQSGLPDLRVANIIRDAKLLESARTEAFALLKQDAHLSKPEHKLLKDALIHKWKDKLELIQVG